jgi:hypothetical protein
MLAYDLNGHIEHEIITSLVDLSGEFGVTPLAGNVHVLVFYFETIITRVIGSTV